MNGRTDEDSRKIFVGGLDANTTKEDLEEYFVKECGPVEMATIKTDVYSGRSRGFGFVIFQNKTDADGACATKTHVICGKAAEAKHATPQNDDGERNTKVFVGGLEKAETTVTKEELKSVFSQRGTVTDVFVPIDNDTGLSKGFAFVTFADSCLATELCAEGTIMVNQKSCDIKKAKNKNEAGRGGRGGFRGGRGGPMGGRGGGRGGFGGGYDGGYDQYGGGYYDQGYGTGYGNGNPYGGFNQGYGGGGYDQYGGGYGQNAGYGSGYYDQSGGYGQDQYKMKGRGGRGGYTPY